MEMFDDADQLLLQQSGLLETKETAMLTDSDYCVKEEDDREQGGYHGAEALQAEMVPTYAPQEPREEETFEEDEGESSSSGGGQHQSWCHISTSGNNLLKWQAFNDVTFDSQNNGDNAIVLADWKKETQMEEPMARATGSKIAFDYRGRQAGAAFCGRWSSSQPRSSHSHHHNDPYHLAKQRRSKGRYYGQSNSGHFNGGEKYQRNVIRHARNPIKQCEVTYGRRMAGTFLLEKSPSYNFNDHHKRPCDSHFNKKKTPKFFKPGYTIIE